MMSKRTQYFRKFPFTEYNGEQCVNIMKRVAFNDNVSNYLSAFYDYEMKDYDRVEDLAYNYYDDVDYDWLIYLSNEMINPYKDIPLSNDNFSKYIRNQYGSTELAQEKVIHFQSNHSFDDRVLTTSAYEALPGNLKKYWDPLFGPMGVVGYERAKEDYKISTNAVMMFDFITELEEPFEVGDLIAKQSDGSIKAEVVWCDTKSCTIQHIQGNFTSESDYVIVKRGTNKTATVNHDTVTVLNYTLPLEELAYYYPVTYYEYEEKQNEDKRKLKLLQADYRKRINRELEEILK